MKTASFNLLEKFLRKSDSPVILKTMEKLMNIGIPFNGPHGFKFKEISSFQAVMDIPFKRANKNHLGTVHACAIATLGEYPAGLLLIKNFAPSEYRVVMVKLEADYHKHGATDLTGTVKINQEAKDGIASQLASEGVASVSMETEITNSRGETCATIITHWQLKRWNMVKKH